MVVTSTGSTPMEEPAVGVETGTVVMKGVAHMLAVGLGREGKGRGPGRLLGAGKGGTELRTGAGEAVRERDSGQAVLK